MWQAINSKTNETVPNAQVIVSFDGGIEPSEGRTDHTGTYSMTVLRAPHHLQGKVFVNADGFEPFSKDFTTSNDSSERLWLDPVPKSHLQGAEIPIPVIAGRVIDSSSKSAISHALVSLSGRSEAALTDDLGNYRILANPRLSHQIVRVQVEKPGCMTVDRNVRANEENPTLELNCVAAQ